MKAIIRTRCGCSREIETTYPPNREVVLPMVPDIPVNVSGDGPFPDKPFIQVRRFELRNFTNMGPTESVAEYYEILKA